jgi:hypothetical protein
VTGPVSYDVLIPTIPHRHEKLLVLLAELDRQWQPGFGVIAYRDNLEVTHGEKCAALLAASQADYVAVMDDDDWISPRYVELILTAIASWPDYVGWREIYTLDGVDQGLDVHSLSEERREGAVFKSGIVHKNPVRRELALLGTWSGGWDADGKWMKSMEATGQVRTEAWIDEVMYYYRYSPSDEFRTARSPLPLPLPPLPSYPWLTWLGQ